MVRHRRLQADVGARPARRLLSARAELRPRGPDGAHGRGVRGGDGRARPRLRAGGSSPLEEVRVGIAWLEGATRSCARGSRRPPSASRGAAASSSPRRRAPTPVFMHEVADVHRELFASTPTPTARTSRPKVERCLAVTDAEAAAARKLRARRARALPRGRTGRRPARSRRRSRSSPRWRTRTSPRSGCAAISLTYPFDCTGWPALALPCGPAEDGLPASLQLVGKPGEDALVLAAGASLVRGTAGH